MIPKIIHYCWFGGNPKPKLAKKCIRTWKKYCPDYQIIEWNEQNYQVSDAPLYVRQAYEAKQWAFVTDYVRLQVVYEHGGIYMDTDVELLQPLDFLLGHSAYFGFEDVHFVNTGHGFGAEAGAAILREIMADYQNVPFLKNDNSFDKTPCPQRNTAAFLRVGLEQNGREQTLPGDVLILPPECFAPKDWKTGELRVTGRTVSVHHYDASWYTGEQKRAHRRRMRSEKRRRLPSRIGTAILGENGYQKLREMLKR